MRGSFWGIEVKPECRVVLIGDITKGRLRITQATLGMGHSVEKSLLQCNVRRKNPVTVLVCALLPNKCETCLLDLEFEEAATVTFSVIGPRSIYLMGYYVHDDHMQSDIESYGINVENTETEESGDLHSEDSKYGGSFIDDSEIKVRAPFSASSNRGKKAKEKKYKRLKKKCKIIDSDDSKLPKSNDDEIQDLSETDPESKNLLGDGLVIEELEKGFPIGKLAAFGRKVRVHFTGRLKETGSIFESTVDGDPRHIRLGKKEVIDGLDKGIDGMRVGDKRRLIVPPSMGFGEEGKGEKVPPNSWLVYDVQLVGVRRY